jgi:chromosome segregation ATPase
LEEEHKLVEKELKMKMEEMESKTSTTVNELEIERNKIHKQLEEAFNNIKCKEFEYTKKINELSENVDKLESKLLKLVNNKSNFEKKDNEKTQLKMKIASIQSSEEELRKRLSEMMQKEAAYEETLSKADKIIATLEHNYKQRIEELETSERNLKTKITQMEDVETRLRSALRPERRTSDSYRKASDLVKELIDAETRECTLREQIRALEISVNQFEQQLTEANQRKIHLETELKDQDELVSTVVNLQQEIESLKKDLNKSLQTQDSLQDMLKETEKYCLQRDEEMHIKYKSLEDEKCDLEITIQHLKHRLRHENALNHSYDSLSITDNYKSIELSLNNNDNSTQDIKQCCESLSFDTKSINNEELEDARLNMEKCLKRAMAVVRMEMRQKVCN